MFMDRLNLYSDYLTQVPTLVWLRVDGVHSISLCYVLLPDCVLQTGHQRSLHTCSHRTTGDHSTGP